MSNDCTIVAPFTGAWIEIRHPLKPYRSGQVAPFTGAWIEIVKEREARLRAKSLPSRERGLKLNFIVLWLNKRESLPSRERGLK